MQEAEIEEDAEATRAVDWDKAAADAAYRAQVERAQERQRILQEQLARDVRPHCALSAINTDYRAYDGLGVTWVLLVQQWPEMGQPLCLQLSFGHQHRTPF